MVFQMLFFFSNAFFTSTWPFSNKPFSHVFPTSSTALQARVQVQNVDDSRCYTGDIQSTHHAGSMEALVRPLTPSSFGSTPRTKSREWAEKKTADKQRTFWRFNGNPQEKPPKAQKKAYFTSTRPFCHGECSEPPKIAFLSGELDRESRSRKC